MNILLSELLNQMGVTSHAEYLGQGRKDVLLYHQGLAIVLEGSYQKQDAENDAKKRIEQLAADVALAIYYPNAFPQDLTEPQIKQKLQTTPLSVRIIVPEDISATLFQFLYKKTVIAKSLADWHELKLNELATLIKEVAQFIISEHDIKEAERDVTELIDSFVTFLSNHQESQTIASNIYDVLYRLYGFSIGDPREIKESIFAQATLAILLSSVYYESIRYVYKLDSLDTLTKASGPQQALEKATADILKIDYQPIFLAMQEMLKLLPPMALPASNLTNLAIRIASKKTLLRRDLAGKVYHKVVGDWSLKKGLATFYTEIPSAYLLLYLAKPKLSRIADFACGSGTLLVAAYSAMNADFRLSLMKAGADKHPAEIEREFHTQFVDLCYAFDVLTYATQITALNISLHSPETPIEDFSSIYTMPLGYREEDESISLGSLELARTEGKFEQIFGEVTKTGIKKTRKELLHKLMDMEPFDVVAINPPFSRTTGRGGKAGGGLFGFMAEGTVRQNVLDDYKKLRDSARDSMEGLARKLLKDSDLEIMLKDDDLALYRQIWQAGEGLLFLWLADFRLKDQGKLCLVLPKGLLSGTSWFLARALLAENYHVKYVVVSYEPNNYNFSHSTSLSECLTVAEKAKEHSENEETTFVILLKKPETSIEAIALANRIEAKEGKYVEAGKARAFLITVKRSELKDNIDNWGRFVSMPSLEVLDEIEAILGGTLRIGKVNARIRLTRLNNLISSIGVDRHRFIDTFQMVNGQVPGSVDVLHGGEEEQRSKMATLPNAYALPLKEGGKAIFKDKSGRLLVPDRIRVDTAHVVSLFCDVPIISNIFYIVRLKQESEDRLKALCLWLNTTWGILTMLASREETHGGFIGVKMSHWRLLPVLDIDSLAKHEVKALATVFDEFKSKEPARIPEQYGVRGAFDKVRIELDLAFLGALGIQANENDLTPLYKEIGAALSQWMGD